MSTELPDHHDADLVLKLYDLRREPVMRESRKAINRTFWPKSYDDLMAVAANPDHPLNAAFRQTSSYWEMVYGMAKYGIIHADFLMESSGEGLLLFAKVHPFLTAFRAATSPVAFQNAEWIATHSPLAGQRFEVLRSRVDKMLEGRG